MRRALPWVLGAVGIVLVVVAISAAIVAPAVMRAASDGRTALREASAAITRKDARAALVEFEEARDLFEGARARLDSPLALPVRVFPLASTHAGVARSLTAIGVDVADAGTSVARSMEELPDQSLALDAGRMDLTRVREAHAALIGAARVLPGIESTLDAMPTGWVISSLGGPRAEATTLLPQVLDGVAKAEDALAGLPSVLAEGGRKRYLVAFSNLSELRGSGGLFGFVTVLRADDGRLVLEDVSGRPTEIFPAPGDVGLSFPRWFPDDFREQAEIFQNINMTTDFPTVGRFVAQTAEAEVGQIDGVIAVDPIGISGVLSLTGQIRVPSWPQTITAENVAKIAMHDVYLEIANNDARERFFEQLVRTAFDRLTSTRIALTPASVGVFDQAVRGGHFRLYSDHGRDQEMFAAIGAAGGTARASAASDVLSVVSQNATGSKGDWFLRRDLRYSVRLDPAERTAHGRLDATFRNTAPATGLPDYVIGSPVPGIPKGTNRQILLLVRTPNTALDRFALAGATRELAREPEGALRAYRSAVDVPANGRVEIEAQSRIVDAVEETPAGLVYRLHVLRQPVAVADFAEIEIQVPKGWRAAGQTRFFGDLTTDVVLEVRLERTLRGALVERLFVEPYRLVRSVLS